MCIFAAMDSGVWGDVYPSDVPYLLSTALMTHLVITPTSVLGWHTLEVVGADLLTVLLSLELFEGVFGLLGGLYCE